MPTSTRIKGRNLILTLDGDDYAVDASSITLTNEDKDGEVRTFADVTPPKQWFFEIDGIQSTDDDSLWDWLWDNDGGEDIEFIFKPHGNENPSVSQPHFTGTVEVKGKPPIGGAADTTFVFSYRLDLTPNTEPERVTS
jgi:hypothetical protein